MRVSFLEMYNEELFDLLGSTDDPLRLRIYEDSTKKVGGHGTVLYNLSMTACKASVTIFS